MMLVIYIKCNLVQYITHLRRRNLGIINETPPIYPKLETSSEKSQPICNCTVFPPYAHHARRQHIINLFSRYQRE